jgi:hypothetical protein
MILISPLGLNVRGSLIDTCVVVVGVGVVLVMVVVSVVVVRVLVMVVVVILFFRRWCRSASGDGLNNAGHSAACVNVRSYIWRGVEGYQCGGRVWRAKGVSM